MDLSWRKAMFNKKISRKKQILVTQKNTNLESELLYNKTKLKDIDLYFTFPGINQLELLPNGSDILLTEKNIEEYLNSIYMFLYKYVLNNKGNKKSLNYRNLFIYLYIILTEVNASILLICL